jgi:hypothetical protein
MNENMTELIMRRVCFGLCSLGLPKGENSRFAMLTSATLLTLIAISCASLGLWRFGTDLGWARNFVFQNGFLSHWQVWTGTAFGVQYASWILTRFVGTAGKPEIIASGRAHPS